MDQFLDLFQTQLLEINDYRLHVWNLVAFAGVLLLSWLIRRIIRGRVKRLNIFRKLPLDDAGRRALLWGMQGALYLGTFWLGLLALGIRLSSILSIGLFTVPDKNEVKVLNLVIIIGIVLGTRIALWYIERLFLKLGQSKRIPLDQGRRTAIFQIFKYIVYVIVLLLILTNIGINLNWLIASSAALFVGLGLALQQTFADFTSGIIILFDGTIEVGDMVVVDSLQLEGKVREIRLRTTIVETLDSITVVVPNSTIASTHVVNWDYNDRETRFRINVGVAYGSDTQLVRKVLKSCAASHGLVLKSPEPRVRFVDFGESSLDFELLIWVSRVSEYLNIMSDIRFKIDAEFRRYGIEIPFPQRDIHIRSDFREKPLVVENGEEDAEVEEPLPPPA